MTLISQLLESTPRKIELSLLQDFDADLLEEMLKDENNVQLCLHNYEVGGLLEDVLEELKKTHNEQARQEGVDWTSSSATFTKVAYLPKQKKLIGDYFIRGSNVDHWAEASVKINPTDTYRFEFGDASPDWSDHGSYIEITKLCQAYYSAMG